MKRWIGITAFVLLILFWISPWHMLFAQVQHGIVWSWTASTTVPVDGYNLYCSTSAAGPFVKANTALIPGTTFFETGLVVGSTYFCQATAVKGALESVHSATSAGVVFQFPPEAPGTPAGVSQ
jgi:hypothetical protein